MHVNNSEQWTEYDRPGSQWFISLHQDGKHATINCRRQMQGLGIPVEAAKAIIEACKFEGHPEKPPMDEEMEHVVAETVRRLKKILGEDATVVVLCHGPESDKFGMEYKGDSRHVIALLETAKYHVVKKSFEE